jgi:hypothetical protein
MGIGIEMKKIALLLLFFTVNAFAVCSNSVRPGGDASGSPFLLTAAKYNNDLNTLYDTNQIFDGECIQDNTIKDASLDRDSFSTLYKSLRDGCAIQSNGSNTTYIGPCRMMINGNTVETTSSTAVTMGCAGCATEASSATYYVYVNKTSDGSALSGFFSSTAPSYHDLDVDGNRCVGRVRNDASGSLLYYSEQMNVGGFEFSDKKIVTYSPNNKRVGHCSIKITDVGGGTAVTYSIVAGECVASTGAVVNSAAGVYVITFKSGFWYSTAPPACFVFAHNETGDGKLRVPYQNGAPAAATFSFNTYSPADAANVDTGSIIECVGPTTI